MKPFFIIMALGLAFSLCSCSSTKLNGTFFSSHQDCIYIDNKAGEIESYEDYAKDGLLVKQRKGKLKFLYVSYAYGGLSPFHRRVDKYKFNVLKTYDDSFVVSPVNERAKKFFNNRDSIFFRSGFSTLDTSIHFSKVFYHSGTCFGSCPELHMEIDSSDIIHVTNNGGAYMPDTAHVNHNYAGKLTTEELYKLNRLFQYAQLKTLKWPPRMCCDAPMRTMIVYYNGERLQLSAMFTPLVSSDLTRFLNNQFTNESLRLVDSTFRYETDSTVNDR